ncbi:MAG TPA: amidohydrolase family protein, partial [Solirubrobacteraceae bacterium]|nr:amidohydrolase family protein [Solirubrobacteraceae bacterium]
QTVMPGLIETHLHVTGEWPHDPHGTHLEPFPESRVLRGLLDTWAVFTAGFTTMFSMGHGHPSFVSAIKQQIDREELPGPRIYHCGWALSQTAGHGNVGEWNYDLVERLRPRSAFADGPYALRALVRENVGLGADFIKLFAGEGGFTAPDYVARRLDFTDEEIRAITDEAHRMGFRVAAHCMSLAHARHAVENGVDRVEHGPVEYEPDFVPLLAEHGTSWCPTLSQLNWALLERERRRLAPAVVERIEGGIAGRCRMIQEALDRGVTVGFGTDNRMRPKAGRNGLEFTVMAEHGIAPLDAVSIGTQLAARLVGLEADLGTVEPGKLADLLVVDGDPSTDVGVLAQPERIARIITSHRRVYPQAVAAS